MIKDYYKVMGLGRAATAEEIKQAYRKLAMEVHPDRNVDKPECEERLKEINEAYSVLGNKGKRRRYDVLCQQSLRAGLRSGEDPDSDLVNVLYAFFRQGVGTQGKGGCRGRGFGRRGCRRWNRNA